MEPGEQSTALLVASLVLGLMGLIGLGVLFALPSRIERRTAVGGATLLGCLLGVVLLRGAWIGGGPDSWAQALGIAGVPVFAFMIAWLVDRALGPKGARPEQDEKTYGAHLSD